MAEEGERQEEGVGLGEESDVTYDKEAVVVQLLSHVPLFVTHGLQHAGLPLQASLPFPSFTSPEAWSDSCPLSR